MDRRKNYTTIPTDYLDTIDSVYARSLALERRIRLAELFPEGIVPYLARQEYQGSIAGPSSPDVVAPTVTTSFRSRYPLHLYKDKAYTYQPQHTMMYIGQMDPYTFNQSIPKFDPWFRTVLKAKSPAICQELESTYMRDPCTPERVMKHMALFDKVWSRKPNNPTMRRAEAFLAHLFKPVGQVEPIDFNFAGWTQIIRQLDMSSSPGLPLRREYATQGECLGFIYDKTKRLNHFAKFLPPPAVRAPPCMIGLRPGLLKCSEVDTKIKARGVWAYPAEVKVMEMRYVIPLIERFSHVFTKIPYPVGRNMTKALPFIIDHLVADGKAGFVTDISKLDTDVGPDWIEWAFSFLEQFYVWGITDSADTRNRNVFQFLKYYFKRTPILFPSGQLVRKAGGVPSGSGFTQIVDTLVTLLMTIYSLFQMGYTEADIEGKIFAVGDDMAVSVPINFDTDLFIKHVAATGFVINKDKVMFSTQPIDLKFLGYSKMGGHVYRPLSELLQVAFFPEKFVGNAERSRQRIAGQTIASGLCNSSFNKFNYWLEELVGQGSALDQSEVYIPQRRWMRNVLGITELPSSTIAFDLQYLT